MRRAARASARSSAREAILLTRHAGAPAAGFDKIRLDAILGDGRPAVDLDHIGWRTERGQRLFDQGGALFVIFLIKDQVSPDLEDILDLRQGPVMADGQCLGQRRERRTALCGARGRFRQRQGPAAGRIGGLLRGGEVQFGGRVVGRRRKSSTPPVGRFCGRPGARPRHPEGVKPAAAPR